MALSCDVTVGIIVEINSCDDFDIQDVMGELGFLEEYFSSLGEGNDNFKNCYCLNMKVDGLEEYRFDGDVHVVNLNSEFIKKQIENAFQDDYFSNVITSQKNKFGNDSINVFYAAYSAVF